MIFARADVERGGTFSLPVDGQFDRTHHIENMGEIAALGSVSIDDDGLPLFDPSAECFHGQVRALSWPPNRKESQRDEADVVELRVELSPMLTVEFG